MFRILCVAGLAFAGLVFTSAATAQELSDGYRRLIADAATYEDGANFDEIVVMVARNATGGPDAVMAAVRSVAPDRTAQAAALLGVAETVTVAEAAPASAPAAAPEAAPGAPAAAPDHTPNHDWTGRVSAGLTFASGNSDQQTWNLGLQLDRNFGNGWSLASRLNYAYGESAGVVSQDQLQIEARGEREIGDRWGVFLGGQYDRDVLSSYDWTAFVSAGATRHVIKREHMHWTLRAGPGVRYLVPSVGTGDETQLVLDLGSDFEWQINDNSTFHSETTVLAAESAKVEQSFRYTTSVAQNWAVEFEWRYRHEFDPLPGFEEGDSRVTASLVREF
jgi:putative salt-induced outer membrane protein YdiY